MKPTINKYTKEVEESLARLSLKNDGEKAAKLKKYIGTKCDVFGIVTKNQKSQFKKGYSFHSENRDATFLIYDAIYKNTKLFEAKNLAFLYLEKNHKTISIGLQLKTLVTWVNHVDNWAHSDTLSKYLTRLLERKETKQELLSIIKKWNDSDNLWERRQSLVSLFYYARTKKEFIDFDTSIKLIKKQLDDTEHYMQKAVGWALRECHTVYPKQTYVFINEHIKNISPTAFTTCIEKMTEAQKTTLKQKRKK